MAGVVIRNLALINGPQIDDPYNVNQELAQLKSALPDVTGPADPGRIVFKQLRVMVLDHTDAGAGGAYNPLGVLERTHKFLGRNARGFPVSRVESGLTAAGLVCGAVHLYAQSPENRQEGIPHFRVKTIHQALNEKSYFIYAGHYMMVLGVRFKIIFGIDAGFQQTTDVPFLHFRYFGIPGFG
jgi:hypothetical protein